MRNIFYVILLCLLANDVLSQSYKFELAAEAGPGFGYVWGKGSNSIKNQKPILSYIVGIGLRFNAPKFFGLHTGVYVERKGFVVPIAFTNKDKNDVIYKYQSQYNYVTIPILCNLSFGKKIKGYLNLGGYVGALFRSHIFLKELDISHVNPGGYQYVDAGIASGLGLKLPIKRWLIGLEARNNTGFIKVVKNTDPKDAIKNTNTLFLVSVAYSFKPW
jgi:hypothetical protein